MDHPHGHRYRRDRTGTTALDPPDPGPPRIPSPAKMTPPHTPPPTCWRGHRHVRWPVQGFSARRLYSSGSIFNSQAV